MKAATENQVRAIRNLANATKTEIKDIDDLTVRGASKLITSLQKKMDSAKKNGTHNNGQNNNNRTGDYQSEALAGLAVKIVAQRYKLGEMTKKPDQFKTQVAELYQVFQQAKQACFA